MSRHPLRATDHPVGFGTVARIVISFVTFGMLAACGGASSTGSGVVDEAAAKSVIEILEGDSEFRDFGSDFIVADIDNLELGAERGFWYMDALGAWELSAGAAKSPVIEVLNLKGRLSAKLSLSAKLHGRVVAVTSITNAPNQARKVEFTWDYADSPAWLKNARRKGTRS